MTRFAIALLLIFLTTPAHSQSVGDIVKPAHNLPVPSAVRDHLSQIADVEAFAPLSNHDAVVVYDTVRDSPGTTNFMDNRPKVAILRDGSVKLNLDVLSLAQGGPAFFNGMALLRGDERNAVAVFAFRLAADGSGTFFVFVGRGPSGYGVTATLQGLQAQLRFESNDQLELWSANGQAPCVWCPKPYRVTKLGWSDGKLRDLSPATDEGEYRPEQFVGEPFVAKK
jgi:hypothetical protein